MNEICDVILAVGWRRVCQMMGQMQLPGMEIINDDTQYGVNQGKTAKM